MGIVEHCIPASNSKSYLYEKERENMLCESVPFFSQNMLFEIDKKESHLLENASDLNYALYFHNLLL